MSRNSDYSVDDNVSVAVDMSEAEAAWNKIHSSTASMERLDKTILSELDSEPQIEKISNVLQKVKRRLSDGKKLIKLADLEKYGIDSRSITMIGSISIRLASHLPMRRNSPEENCNHRDTIGTVYSEIYEDDYDDDDFDDFDDEEEEGTL